jgi:hypothetical protein
MITQKVRIYFNRAIEITSLCPYAFFHVRSSKAFGKKGRVNLYRKSVVRIFVLAFGPKKILRRSFYVSNTKKKLAIFYILLTNGPLFGSF